MPTDTPAAETTEAAATGLAGHPMQLGLRLFTLSAHGRPALVFPDRDRASAEASVDGELADYLQTLVEHSNAAIRNGDSGLTVRDALPEEAAAWHADLARARVENPAVDENDWGMFLVETATGH